MVVGDIATGVDVAVLGAGSGGYAAAIRAAQLGKAVALIDLEPPGGASLLQGCMPAKLLQNAVARYRDLSGLAAMGIAAGPSRLDWPQLQRWVQSRVEARSQGIEQLLKANQVAVVRGRGRFLAENELRVEAEYGAQRYLFEQAIIAVGAAPAPLPVLPFDGQRVLTPAQALALPELPESIGVIGADYIAVELASLFAGAAHAGADSRVWLVTPPGRRLLDAFEPFAGRLVRFQLEMLGVSIVTNLEHPFEAADMAGCLVVSDGLTPNTAGLQLEAAAVQSDERGFIPVNNQMQSSNPAIYAVGDVTGGPPLAHLAIKQGKTAAQHLAGRPAYYGPQAVPRVVQTQPWVAAVGLTVAEAEGLGYQVVTGRFPPLDNDQVQPLPDDAELVHIVAERDSEVLLGVTAVGAQAAALIGEAALALEMGATLTDLAETLHPHFSLGEALQQAAEAALGLGVRRLNHR